MSTFLGTDGHDTITPEHVSPGVIAGPAFPAPGDRFDLILGGRGDDSIEAAGGRDVIAGGRGEDTILAGAGDDTILWSHGDGNDSVEGGSGFDTLVVQGFARAEVFNIYDGFDELTVNRDIGLTNIVTNGIERLEIHAAGSNGPGDYIQVNDLSETNLEELLIAFGPGGRDEIAFIGGNEAQALDFSRTLDGGIVVDGLGVRTEITGFEAAQDRLIVALGEGNDTIDARAFSGAGLIISAGGGADLGLLGMGNDRWSTVDRPGADTVDGSGGFDTLDLDASPRADVVVLAGNAAEFTASYAGDTMLLREFQRVEVETSMGDDLVDASALVGVQLLAWGGTGDDTILGGARGDLLVGGWGDDKLTGGGGRDRFVFGAENTNGATERDTVTDYRAGDVLDLRGLAGGFTAEATAEGLLLTFAEADMDQLLLAGVASLAQVDILV